MLKKDRNHAAHEMSRGAHLLMQVAQVQRGCHAGRGQSDVQQGVLPGLSYCQAADGDAPAHRLCSKQLPIVERLRHCTRHVIHVYLQAVPVGEHCS